MPPAKHDPLRPLRLLLIIGLPVITTATLALAGVDAVASWQARNGGGTTGTFTAERRECSSRTCNFHGSWSADDGSRTRPDVILYDAPTDLTVGRSISTVDTGARKGVFSLDGGIGTFLITAAITLVGLAAAVVWVLVLLWTARNTWRRRRTSRT